MSIVKLNNVHFAYKKGEDVLSGINLSVPQGSIYGFLGVNGAGKTTTIRLILSLIQSNQGTIQLFDEDIKTSYPKHLRKVGSLIENPSLYSHLSGYDNLKICANYFGVSQTHITDVLALVNLTENKNKLAGNYSTGMKQRLGLGISLLHNPELLILDEPTNGLDPKGIIEFRSIIHQLRDQGKTIVLSSHILSEVEKIVSHLGIINNGSIVFEGPLETLQELKRKNITIRMRVSDHEKALQILNKYKPILELPFIEFHIPEENDIPSINNTLMNSGIDLFEIIHVSKGLEHMFLNMTNQ